MLLKYTPTSYFYQLNISEFSNSFLNIPEEINFHSLVLDLRIRKQKHCIFSSTHMVWNTVLYWYNWLTYHFI